MQRRSVTPLKLRHRRNEKVATTPVGPARRQRDSVAVPTWFLPAVPATLIYCGVYLPALATLCVLSVYHFVPGELPVAGATFKNYTRFLDDSYYLGILKTTLYLSLIASIITVALSFPLAYSIVRSRLGRRVILPIVTLSFFVSAILVIYGWIIILGRHGALNETLMWLHIVSTPLSILFTNNAVVVGLVDTSIPYATLILAAALTNIDPSLERASQNLGATQWQTFFRVTLPLARPGIVAALVLAFAQSVSAFVIPLLLGGGRVPMLATQVYDAMIVSVNYPFAAATVVIILGVIFVATYGVGAAMRTRSPKAQRV
jgi:putative spermidine/putrescine transport system permease protein